MQEWEIEGELKGKTIKMTFLVRSARYKFWNTAARNKIISLKLKRTISYVQFYHITTPPPPFLGKLTGKSRGKNGRNRRKLCEWKSIAENKKGKEKIILCAPHVIIICAESRNDFWLSYLQTSPYSYTVHSLPYRFIHISDRNVDGNLRYIYLPRQKRVSCTHQNFHSI